jgi:hypothetical protein
MRDRLPPRKPEKLAKSAGNSAIAQPTRQHEKLGLARHSFQIANSLAVKFAILSGDLPRA